MQFQMGFVDACAVLGPFALFGIWVAACFGMLGLLQTVRRFPKTLRAAVLVVVLFGSTSPAFASVPMPEHCTAMNNAQWPCWIIEAMWCPCYWDDQPPLPW